jgi:hypothetical protein
MPNPVILNNISALRASTDYALGVVAFIMGYYVSGDGGDGEYFFDSTAMDAENGGAIIKPTAINSSNPGRWRAIFVNNIFNIKRFGAKSDGVADNRAIINALISSLGSGGGGTIYVPVGNYYCSDSIIIEDKTVYILGEVGSQMGNPSAASQFVFPSGVIGISILRGSGNHQESVIEKISLRALAKNSSESHGMVLTARCTLRDVTISNFSGHGIKIFGILPSSDCSLSILQRVRISSCTGDGLNIIGSDANQCTFIAIDTVDCGGWGIHDNSFLGNQYYNCHVNNCSQGPYFAENVNARSAFIGCYSEEGMTSSIINGYSNVVGGLHGSPVNIIGNGTYINGKYSSGMFFYDPSGSGPFTGFQNGGLIWGPNPVTSQNFRLGAISNQVAHWALGFDNQDSQSRLMEFLGTNSQSNGIIGQGDIGRKMDYATVAFRSVLLNNKAVQSVFGFADSYLLGKSFLKGDVLLNKGYNGRNPIGWICIYAGTMGTYSEGLTARADTALWLSGSTNVLQIGQTIVVNGIRGTIKAINNVTFELTTDVSMGYNPNYSAISYTTPEWRAFGHGVGPTSDRPTLSSSDSGFWYFDTTLNQNIYWTGTTWLQPGGGNSIENQQTVAQDANFWVRKVGGPASIVGTQEGNSAYHAYQISDITRWISLGIAPTQTAQILSSTDMLLTALNAKHVLANSGFAFKTLSLTLSGTNLNTDASLGNEFTITLTGNRVMTAPINPKLGQQIRYRLKQDSVGSRLVTWNSVFRFPTTAPTLSTVANRTDYVTFIYNDADARWDCLATAIGIKP